MVIIKSFIEYVSAYLITICLLNDMIKKSLSLRTYSWIFWTGEWVHLTRILHRIWPWTKLPGWPLITRISINAATLLFMEAAGASIIISKKIEKILILFTAQPKSRQILRYLYYIEMVDSIIYRKLCLNDFN